MLQGHLGSIYCVSLYLGDGVVSTAPKRIAA